MAEPHAMPSHDSNVRRDALAEIQFASILDPDLTQSEDDVAEERDIQTEDAQSVIGVSIGHAQTRLASPYTPAAEKAAVLDEAGTGALFVDWEQSADGTIEQRPQLSPDGDSGGETTATPQQEDFGSGQVIQDERPARVPSPWRAAPRRLQKMPEGHRAVLRESLMGHRKRAWSGGSATDTLKKYIPFNLPSMPKSPNLLNFSLPTFSITSNLDILNARGRSMGYGSNRKLASIDQAESSSRAPEPHNPSSGTQARSIHHERSASGPLTPSSSAMASPTVYRRQHTSTMPTEHNRPPTLRRSTSDNSLVLARSFSLASSLGDDSRFENVQEQVNSRIKALKDSWQDSNFKLPSMPTFSTFSFGSRDDMFRMKNPTSGRTSTLKLTPATRSSSLSIPSFGAGRGVPKRDMSSKLTNPLTTSSTNATTHPFLSKALEELEGDVVILGGYRGSVLRSAEPPHRQLWVPLKVGLNLRKVDLEVGLDHEDEETEEQRVIQGGMLTHIGPVDISRRLIKRLRHSENAKNGVLRVHNYGYDWRLSPHLLSRKLIEFLKTLPCNRAGVDPNKRGAVVIAHSLGGLITRHAINQQPELVSGVIYAGVPQTCVNILGPMRNGDDVMLSSRVLTAQVNFTIRTSYALLPLDGKCFFNKYTKEEYPVDFFDINTWKEFRLSPCIAPPLPALYSQPNTSMGTLLNAMSSALPSFGRKGSFPRSSSDSSANATSSSTNIPLTTSPVHQAVDAVAEGGAQTAGVAPQMNNKHPPQPSPSNPAPSPSTTVTIPYHRAVEYLTRTLAEVKLFKQQLAFNPSHHATNLYPPAAVIYGKSTPTVYGAKVESREAIKRADAYDELAFASGDGVVLARAAMVPEGYSVVRGGVVSSERGHVTLLGDLEAVGKCLLAVVAARKTGVGMGKGERGKE